MANNRLARPYFERPANFRWPLGLAARRTLGKYHTGGTWHYVPHTVGGITRLSHYLTGETWVGTNAIIYRVRRGNGYFGSKAYERYQDQYSYFVPSSINNIQGAAARSALATAVYNWQNVLTEAQKIAYNKRATKGLRMSGYNLYLREYIKANA
jgi:hypothetical protein